MKSNIHTMRSKARINKNSVDPLRHIAEHPYNRLCSSSKIPYRTFPRRGFFWYLFYYYKMYRFKYSF